MRLLSCLLFLAMLPFSADHAHACSLSWPYITVQSVSPADNAQEVPRDAVIRVEVLRNSAIRDQTPVLAVTLSVTRADTGEAVAGVLDTGPTLVYAGWASQSTGYLTWAPSQPLAANTQYRIAVSTEQTPVADAGPTTSDTTFTTSDQLVPELALTGPLSVTLSIGSEAVLSCDTSLCLTTCTKTGERAVVYADVVTPAVSGGFDEFGYTAIVWGRDDKAPEFDGPNGPKPLNAGDVNVSELLVLKPGQESTVHVALPRRDQPYDACFGFNAWDLRGKARTAEPVCVPASQVAALFAELEGEHGENDSDVDDSTADAGAADAAVASRVDDHVADSACSAALSGRPTRPFVGWLAVVVVCFVRRSSARRRPSSLP